MVGVVLECLSSHVERCANSHHEETILQNGCNWAAWRRARLTYCDTNRNRTHDHQHMKVERSNSKVVRKTNGREIWTIASKSKMYKSALLFLFMIFNLSIHVVMVSAVSASASFTQSCSFDVETKSLWCSLRTLNAQNNTSSSMPSAARAEHITVQCSNVFFYESILKINHFGYLPNLRKLDLNFCKIRRVPALAFSGLSGLQELNIQTHNSEWSAMVIELEQDAFTGLNDLRKLNFTHNNLWTLPKATFCGLNSLAVLNLSSNFLQDVSNIGFGAADLHGCRIPLETLDLSYNSLTKLPSDAFSQLPKLNSLRLDGNKLSELEDRAFGGLSSLQTLNLANNNLNVLPPELFTTSSSPSRLQELYLQNNSLNVLAPGLFSNLHQLLVLNISRNEISDEWLSSSTFSSLTRLVALDLSHNKLSKLDQHILRGMNSLQILNLKHNLLHNIAPNTFIRQHNLHILLLSHNRLDELHQKALSGMSVLKSLSLDNNMLSRLHRNALKNCSSLQDLALNNNRFSDVPRAIKPLSLLRTLDVGENNIETLHNDSLKGLRNLYGLRLAGNGLHKVEAGAFVNVDTLQVLNLAHNKLANLDQSAFHPLVKLQMLRLDNNLLKDINGLLTSQSELRWLNISTNQLAWFDYAFIPRSLKWLDLHENEIEELGNYYSLADAYSLKTIDASRNKIKELKPLSLPSSVEFVFLKGNHITEIKANTFLEKANLKSVDLTSNHLRQLNLSSLSISPSSKGEVPEFLLGYNPFFCDCEMEWLQKINQMAHHRQHPRVLDLDNVYCKLNNRDPKSKTKNSFHRQHYLPHHNNHKNSHQTGNEIIDFDQTVPIMQVKKQEFLCEYQAHCFALCMCCDFFACDCRMQCPDGCSCFHDSTWSANVIRCSLREHEVIPSLIPMDATSIHLDGNNFTGTLISQAFIGRKRVQSLYLNASQIEGVNNQTFNGLTELEVLHLEDNFIRRIEGYEFGNLTALRELHLQRNRIDYIDENAFFTLISLQVLQLHDNHLVSLQGISQLSSLPYLSSISLSGNPWICQCDFVHDFNEFAKARQDNVIFDEEKVTCLLDNRLSQRISLGENITCSEASAVMTYPDQEGNEELITVVVSVMALVVIVTVAIVILFVFRTPLRVWLHSKYGIRLGSSCGICRARYCCGHWCCINSGRKKGGLGEGEHDRLYDAFVGYSAKEEDFVQQVIVPQLEIEEPSLKLCLQHRDLPNTSSIADTFPGVSQLCAKHVLIVSRSYLETEWIQIKFALQELHKKIKFRPIIVLLEELSSLDLAAAPEFNLLLKTAIVLNYWEESSFWNKLRYYLPDSSKLRHRRYKKTYRRNVALGGQTVPNPCTSTIGMNGPGIASTSPKSLLSSGSGSSNNTVAATPLTYNRSGINRNRINQIGGTPSHNWNPITSPYDNLPSNNSSTSTRSTTAAGTVHHQTGLPNSENVKLVANPLNDFLHHNAMGHTTTTSDQWSDDSASYSWHDHTYQSVPQQQQQSVPGGGGHIYHTLDPETHQRCLEGIDAVGSLDVMLPNGQLVPATLVRNNTGRIVPIVQVNSSSSEGGAMIQQQGPASNSATASSTSTTSVSPPPTSNESNGIQHPMQVTFPKTVVYKTEGRAPSRGEADGQMDRAMRTPNIRQNEFKPFNAMGSSPQRRNNFGTTSGSPRGNFISQPQSHPLGNKGGYLV